MNILGLPKDILAFIIKRFKLRDIAMMRQVCKHFNDIVKSKLHRLWFCKYIQKIATTGNYAYKYNVVVPRKHIFTLHIDFKDKIDITKHNTILRNANYEEETSIDIPIIQCYTSKVASANPLFVSQTNSDFQFFWTEGSRMKDELMNTMFHEFQAHETIQNRGFQARLQLDHFPSAYACTKVIQMNPHIFKPICSDKRHYELDLPRDENDTEWFTKHENLTYDKSKCYLSHYLIACYRIQRDLLDKEKDSDYYRAKKETYKYVKNEMIVDGKSVVKRQKVWGDRFKKSIFHGCKLQNYKCI